MQKDVTITYDINNTIERLKKGKILVTFSAISFKYLLQVCHREQKFFLLNNLAFLQSTFGCSP